MVGQQHAKSRLWIAAAILLLLLLALLGWATLAWFRPAPIELTNSTLDATDPLYIGGTATCSVDIQTPWFAVPRTQDIQLPDSLQLLNPPRRSLARIRPMRWIWRFRVPLQPLQTGTLTPGTMAVRIRRPGQDPPETLTINLPELSVAARPADALQSLAVAGPLQEEALDTDSRMLLFSLVALLTGLAVILAILLIKRRGKPAAQAAWQPPAHVRALADLQSLENELPMKAAPFYVKLTDILRGYVEKRYQIRASEQTTPEFLRCLARNSELHPARRQALERFMRAADMVKFARGSASEEDITQSLEQARQFVTETAPSSEADAAVSPTTDAAAPAAQ